MAIWEYKVVVQKVLPIVDEPRSLDDDRASMLNTHGMEGWELVSVINQSYRRESDPTTLYGYSIFSYFFKRLIVR
jgi:hypothetical protein